MRELSAVGNGSDVVVPALALIVIAGGSRAARDAFVARNFTPAEIAAVEIDTLADALATIDYRLRQGALVAAPLDVTDATSHSTPLRLARLAHSHDVAPIAILLDESAVPPPLYPTGPHGFERVFHLPTAEERAATCVRREPLACDYRHERGPFDIIGDVHGCYDELIELLAALGYTPDARAGMRHPAGRRALFVGDLVDRGPGVVEVASLVMEMAAAGQAFCVPGNHDIKLLRALLGRHVWVNHGLQDSLDQIGALPPRERADFSDRFRQFILDIPPYLVLEGGALVVAHAGLPERYHGRVSGRVRSLVYYGEDTGETDEYGLPVRIDWAADYRGAAAVVYGHTPLREPAWRNNTINIDTGCVFGGRLSAARWPERDLVSVPARRVYAYRAKPL